MFSIWLSNWREDLRLILLNIGSLEEDCTHIYMCNCLHLIQFWICTHMALKILKVTLHIRAQHVAPCFCNDRHISERWHAGRRAPVWSSKTTSGQCCIWLNEPHLPCMIELQNNTATLHSLWVPGSPQISLTLPESYLSQVSLYWPCSWALKMMEDSHSWVLLQQCGWWAFVTWKEANLNPYQ